MRIRLAPEAQGSSLVLGTATSHGAFVDDIAVSNSQELINSVPTPLSSSASGFNFNPPAAVTYAMRVRAQAGTHWFGFGPVRFVTAQVGQPTDPDIHVTPTGLAFGDVQVGSSGRLTLTISNRGDANLSVTSLTSSNGRFTVSSGAPLSISAGGQQSVTVTFSPVAAGAQSGTLTILSNDPDEASVAVSVSGTGIAQPGGNVIYETDFSDFPAGVDTIAGTNGWSATPSGDGSSGTLSPAAHPQLGQSAYVGFNPPTDDFVGIWRPLNRDPVAEGNPVVEFSADLIIIDSTNGIYDIFSLRFYNSSIDLLATITFDNRNLNIHTWDGNGFRDTGRNFENGPLFTLSGTINFATNTWSAKMVSSSPGSDHVPLFTDLPFHSGGHPVDLGLLLFAWQLDDQTGASAGNNFMLIDNYSVSFAAQGAAPRVTRTWTSAGGVFNMTWDAIEGYSYQVRHSPDLKTWSGGLPNSTFTTGVGQTQHTFTDRSAGARRYYRVTATPPSG